MKMSVYHHLVNECRLSLYLARRYWLEAIAGFAGMLMLFGGLIYTVTVVGDATLQSGKLDTLIVGFTLWMFAGSAYSSTSNEVAEEIRQRTLEQLCLTPVPLWTVLLFRSALRLAGGTFALVLTLLIIGQISDGRITGNYFQILSIILLSAPSLVGLGFLISGMLLLVRKAETIHLLVYPGLIALIALPAYPLGWLSILPYTFGASLVKASTSGTTLFWADYTVVALNSALWLTVGIVAFVFLERKARRLGVMGHI